MITVGGGREGGGKEGRKKNILTNVKKLKAQKPRSHSQIGRVYLIV